MFSLAVVVIGSASAASTDAPPMTADAWTASFTLSPVHLVIPIFEVTGEFRIGERGGVALIGGYGWYRDAVSVTDSEGNTATTDLDAWEAGLQGRYYALGDFRHGIEAGGEILFLDMETSEPVELEEGGSDVSVDALGGGFSIGAFGGAKHVFDFGLTLDGQLGFAWTRYTARAAGAGFSAESGASGWGPLLNLNVGWSF